ncbi:MAG: hypothetical protein JSV79_03845 [Armatimonadota bacterium]|nr:MAG: hypothetical protein JSV79_03845 [Armatimonadota bacterium]
MNGQGPPWVVPGEIPEGLEGSIIGEMWKSGVEKIVRITFGKFGNEWMLCIVLYRKEPREKEFRFPVPKKPQDLWDSLLSAFMQMRDIAPLMGPPPNIPSGPKDMDTDMGAVVGPAIKQASEQLRRQGGPVG